MAHYVGLNVSQKTTAICVVDAAGQKLWRGVCGSDPEQIAQRVPARTRRRARRCGDGANHAVARARVARLRPGRRLP